MSTEYRIKHQYGGFFAYDEDGRPLNQQALANVIRGLIDTYEQMESCDQDKVRNQYLAARAHEIIAEATIHMPVNHPYACHGDCNRRPPDEKRFMGVYVVSTMSRPGRVKIGRSKDIFIRTKGLYHQYGQLPIKAHAIIEHPEYQLLETYIHHELNDYRIEGEWFEAEPALEYIRGLAS